MNYALSALIGIIIGVTNVFFPSPSDPPKQDQQQEERKDK